MLDESHAALDIRQAIEVVYELIDIATGDFRHQHDRKDA